MSIRQTFDTWYLCWLSKPVADRMLYRWIRQHRISSILELGLSSEKRTVSMLRLARRLSPQADLRYVGLDMFDARPVESPRLTLKHMHQALHASGATVRLIPGDVSGLVRWANQLQNLELVIVGAEQPADALARSWSFILRVLAPQGHVLQAQGTGAQAKFQVVSREQVEQLARQSEKARRAA